MESFLASMTYKGSIPEAIEDAKRQKKLFVVYISGEDAESTNLESSTWTNSIVAESLMKYCILLHFQDGSTEAKNFSAIYPHKSVPCITAVGSNGLQVWQNEGFVTAEVLVSSLEKAWLSLHIQETTASFVTAALTAKKYEPSTSGAASIGQSEQGSSLSTAVPSHTVDKHVSCEAKPSVTCKIEEESDVGKIAAEEANAEMGNRISSESLDGSRLLDADEQYNSSAATTTVLSPALANLDSGSGNLQSSPEDGLTVAEAKKVMQCKKAESLSTVEPMDNHAKINKPTEVHLNIRLPDGINLQETFLLECSLRLVKDYVDRNKATDIGPYDLAIPYPRHVFSDQDLSKSLSELNLFNRQTLLVVPHQKATGFHGGRSSSDQLNSETTAESSSGNSGGYFSYIRRIMSYVNPFYYLSNGASSSSTGEESQSGFWQYSPNPTSRNGFSGAERPYVPYSPNRSTSTGRNDSRSGQSTTSRYGSNIHTLKHDEDDDQFSNRNSFWNGNSTQYSGDNDAI